MQKKKQKIDPPLDQTLRESELRYRRLFEAAQDGILILDAQTGAITDVNPYLMDLLGYTHTEFLEKKLWEVGAFRDIPASQDKFEALQKNQIIRYDDLPLKTKDGRLIKVEFVSNAYQVGEQKVIQCNIRNITGRKLVEAELKKSEEKYRALVTQNPDGIFVIDLEGNFFSVNKAMCDGLNYSEEELLAMKIWDIVPAEHIDQHRKRMAKILLGERLDEPSEYRVRGKDGKYHTIEVSSAPYYKENELVGFQGIARDITARKHAEADLRQSEERYHTIFAESPLGIATTGRDFHFLSANTTFCRMLGYTEQELVLLTFRDLTHPEHLVQDSESVNKLLTGEIPLYKTEKRYLRKDGGIVWAAATISVIRDAGGEYLHFLVLVDEISERKSSDEQLRRSEQDLKRAQAAAHVGSWKWNVQSNKIEGSDELLRIFGLDQETFSGNFAELIAPSIHPDDRPKVDQSVRSVVRGEKPEPLEFRVVLPDKSVRYLWAEAGELVLDERGSPAFLKGIVQDVSERMQAQEEIASRLAELEAVNKISIALRAAQSLDEMLPLLLDATLAVLQAPRGIIWLYDQVKDELRLTVSRGWDDSDLPTHKPGAQVAGYVFASKMNYFTSEYRQDLRLPETVRNSIPPGLGGAAVLIRAGNAEIGVLISVFLSPAKSPRVKSIS